MPIWGFFVLLFKPRKLSQNHDDDDNKKIRNNALHETCDGDHDSDHGLVDG